MAQRLRARGDHASVLLSREEEDREAAVVGWAATATGQGNSLSLSAFCFCFLFSVFVFLDLVKY